jgi:23S rRNA pseudouridine2605 synthase
VLAACGFGSRRAMEEMILAGRITVNRMPAEIGQKVGPGDEVRINGEMVKVRFTEPRPRILIYHKPAGEIVTRDDPEGRTTVFEKLPSIGNGKWINVGRLDYNTEGLLLFTNSGELANRLMHPRYEVAREYAVRVMGRLTDEQMQSLTTGIELDDGVAKCDSVEDGGGDEDASNHWYKVVLHEGRNREVRRLFEKLGVMVSRLIRTRYGPVAMPTVLKRGDLQELDPQAVTAVTDSAGLQARSGGGGGAPHRHRDTRGGTKQQGRRPGAHGNAGQGHGGSHAFGSPGARPHGNRPHGQGGKPGHRPHGKGPRPHGAHPGQGPRQGGHDTHPGGNGFARPHGGGPRPQPRPKGNFDEVQPMSNANASPFATTRLSLPHGHRAAHGHEQPGFSRFRSGPRAKGAGGHPQHRHPRGPQNPRGEANGNVAPRGETPPPVDDEN